MPNLELSLEDVKHLRNHLTFACRYLEEGIEAETDSEIVELAKEELKIVDEYMEMFTNFIKVWGEKENSND